jgi:hypothetical protein
MATKCAFPDDKNPAHKEQVLTCIREAMFDHNEDHGRVEEGTYQSQCLFNTDHYPGFYPKYEDSMATYVRNSIPLMCTCANASPQLFDDRSTFRGEIKTVARQVVKHHYRDQIFPQEDIPGQKEYMEAVAKNVGKLTKTGEFCHIQPSATQVCAKLTSQIPLTFVL